MKFALSLASATNGNQALDVFIIQQPYRLTHITTSPSLSIIMSNSAHKVREASKQGCVKLLTRVMGMKKSNNFADIVIVESLFRLPTPARHPL